MNRRWRSKVMVVATGLTLWMPTALLSTASTAAGATEITPPAAPINVDVIDVGWQQVTLTWEHGSSHIPWMYRIDNLTTGDVWTVGGSDTSAQVKRLDPEQTYLLQLKSADVYASSEPVEVTVTTAAMPDVDPPSGLEVVDVAWNGVDLAWQPSPDEDLRNYEIVDLERDRIAGVVGASTTGAHLELRPEQTYRFAVRAARSHVDGQQVHSELTNEITVTTPEQTIEPPKNLQADLDGRSVTLTWQRPDELDFPNAEVEYLVFDGDALETTVTSRVDNTLQQVIPRITAGEHEFTVRVRYRFTNFGSAVSGPSNPAVVAGPPSDEVTLPRGPDRLRTIVDCNTGAETYELQGATDDTSPLDGIQYQSIRRDLRTDEFYVLSNSYDVPRTGSIRLLFPGPDHRFRLRAVDEAGNRSEIAELRQGEEEFVNC